MINEFNDNILRIYVNSRRLKLYLGQEFLFQFLLTVFTIQLIFINVPPDPIGKPAIFCKVKPLDKNKAPGGGPELLKVNSWSENSVPDVPDDCS